ncbi:Uncharacterised protein [Mycobacteroides abscessus subsp. massiliense]|nr:Uncharacterised protein [Mycobacteroides abscessus subsp. massiliense]
MHDHRRQVSGQDAEQLARGVTSPQGVVHADPCHACEERMRERAQSEPDDRGQHGLSHGVAAADIGDVFEPRESRRGDTRVHQAVGQ